MGMAMPKDLGKQPHSPAHKILSPNRASGKGCMRVEQGKGGGAREGKGGITLPKTGGLHLPPPGVWK